MKIKELIQELSKFDANDYVVLSTCNEYGDEIDLFDFGIDSMPTQDFDGNKYTEVRICQLPHKEY